VRLAQEKNVELECVEGQRGAVLLRCRNTIRGGETGRNQGRVQIQLQNGWVYRRTATPQKCSLFRKCQVDCQEPSRIPADNKCSWKRCIDPRRPVHDYIFVPSPSRQD